MTILKIQRCDIPEVRNGVYGVKKNHIVKDEHLDSVFANTNCRWR